MILSTTIRPRRLLFTLDIDFHFTWLCCETFVSGEKVEASQGSTNCSSCHPWGEMDVIQIHDTNSNYTVITYYLVQVMKCRKICPLALVLFLVFNLLSMLFLTLFQIIQWTSLQGASLRCPPPALKDNRVQVNFATIFDYLSAAVKEISSLTFIV